MKKSIDAIDSTKNSELEKSRVQYLCKLGINDITAEMLDFSLKKIQQIEENKEKLKKLKKEEYIQRKIEKIIEKYNQKSELYCLHKFYYIIIFSHYCKIIN